MSIVKSTLFSFTLAWTGAAMAQTAPVRPTLASLTFTLDDGRSYGLTSAQLADPQGGAVFWGDWAATNILIPYYVMNPNAPVTGAAAMSLWTTGHSGELPAFLVITAAGPVWPLDPGGPVTWGDQSIRPKVVSIVVAYTDGRALKVTERGLHDPRSGVIVWNDFSVAGFFIPFYRAASGLPTRPEDVLRKWTTPTAAPLLATGTTELPAYLLKPQCMPIYPEAD
jgi:hypothetical protein